MELQDQQSLPHNDERLLEELLELDPQNLVGGRIQEQLTRQPDGELTQQQRTIVIILRDQASKRKADELLQQPSVRQQLCAALLQASDDVFELSKIITGVFLGLVAAGTITIPLVPVLLAAIALQVSRMGVASLCVD